MARIFVAVPVPDEARDHLDEHLDVLRTVQPDLKWVRPQSYHVTVRFIGECGPREVDRQIEHWAGRADASASLPMALAGAGCFPQAWRARVLYAAVATDDARWRQLAGPDQHPHLTIARARELSDLTGTVHELEEYVGPSWVAHELVVMRSTLHRGRPAQYEPIEVLALGDAHP